MKAEIGKSATYLLKQKILQDFNKKASEKQALNTAYGKQVSGYVTVEAINNNKRLLYLIDWILDKSRKGEMPQITKIIHTEDDDNLLTGFIITDSPGNMQSFMDIFLEYENLMNDLTKDRDEDFDLGISLNKIGEIK